LKVTTKSRGKRPSQKGSAILPYATGCYAVPIRFLYGTAAEINFWDVVYFRAHVGAGSFDTSIKELVEQMGLSRQVVGRLRRQAVEQGELTEDVSWISGYRFTLRIPDFDRLTKGIVWKPLGYVRNGWHHVVTPAIPKRVLNLYLQQPRQRVYRLDPGYIAAKCKRRFPYGGKAVAPLNSGDVGKTLQFLVRLGLLVPDGDGFRIDWVTFNRPAPSAGLPFDAPDPREHPLFRRAAAADPGRAERALELLNTGRYDTETHFTDIFRDLAYVRGDDYPLLKAKAYRHRNRPPGPNRWRNTWRAFQYELKRRVTEVQTPKCFLGLSDTTRCQCALTLDPAQVTGAILAIRLVSRVEWPWHFEAASFPLAEPSPGRGTTGVRLELRSNDALLFARTITPGDAEVRYAFHPDEWSGSPILLTLTAQCDRPLPGVHVEAWLEARVRR
jgi:hypothetical protein